MNNRPPDDERNDGEAIDPGRPIAELAALAEEPNTGFLARIVRRIERRSLATDTMQFGWFGLGLLFQEYWAMVMSAISGDKSPPEENS